jgi:2',3'-cyclic-nucleotide 2'-phosphodiesterase (5'-nucleotidase family)
MHSRQCIQHMRLLCALVVVSSLVACSRMNVPAPVGGRAPGPSQAAAPPILRIIGTNDFHGGLQPRPNSAGVMWGGAEALAGAIRRARNECTPPACYSILVDAGDEFQGQAPSTIARGKPVSEIFNTIGYDVAAMGNHDLDWGADTLRLRMAEEQYPVLSANYRRIDRRPVDWVRPTAMIRRGPFVVGVIGIMTVEANAAVMAKNLAGYRFVDPVPIVDSLAADLRAHGANVVIVAAHAGARCDATGKIDCHGEILETARRLTQKIDAIVAGHSHELVNTTVNGIPITGARMAGQAIGIIDLSGRGSVVGQDVRLVFPDSLPRDMAISRMVSAAITAAGPRLNTRVAIIAQDLRNDEGHEYPLGNLLVDGMRAALSGADFAATNATGFRASLFAGEATYGALFDIQPFGNRLMSVTAGGAAMRRYFENMAVTRGSSVFISGAVVTLDTSRKQGTQVAKITLPNGRELDDRATYTIVITDFMSTGGLGLSFPDSTAVVKDLSILDVDASIAYLRSLPSPVRAPREKRWVVERK